MYDYGFIGYGSMGSMLVKRLIQQSNVSQDSIMITRKNKERLAEIKNEWPEIHITQDLKELVINSKHIFICVKPSEFYGVLNEIKTHVLVDQHIISIAGAILLSDIQNLIPCKITKIIPTVISEVNNGITLICHNSLISEEEAKQFEATLNNFTKIRRTPEEYFGFVTEFTSCGPGLFAEMLQEFVEAGYRYSNSIPKEEIVTLVTETVLGTVRLMLENSMDFSEVITRVATKGGITEEGVKVMKAGFPKIFDEVFEHSMSKRKLVDTNLHMQFLVDK